MTRGQGQPGHCPHPPLQMRSSQPPENGFDLAEKWGLNLSFAIPEETAIGRTLTADSRHSRLSFGMNWFPFHSPEDAEGGPSPGDTIGEESRVTYC